MPDHTFERATRRARDMGMSRSEFFARAAQRYLDELDAESVTRQIDAVVSLIDGADEAERDAVEVGRRVAAESDDW